MRRTSFQQFAIVQGDTAQQLTERLNRTMYELRDKDPTVTFEGLIARISYMESEEIHESVKDDFEHCGIKLQCRDCPFFEPMLKKDGTEDRRTELGRCEFAAEGYSFKTAGACEKLFRMINDREVALCFREK